MIEEVHIQDLVPMLNDIVAQLKRIADMMAFKQQYIFGGSIGSAELGETVNE